MSEFERLLDECLQALRAGVDIESCLAHHPEHADALRPQLLAADAVARAFEARPRDEFAVAARERFLVASGQRIQEGLGVDPAPSFFAAARVRFLMAAQRMGLADRARDRHRLPLFGTRFRALALTAAAFAMFLGFSTYTVASANSALPGDWRYPVKLQTERVRLALAFGEDAKRDVRIDIAEERVEEIQAMAQKGRIIGPGVISRLRDQAQPLAEAVSESDLDVDDLERVQAVSEKAKVVLAQAEPQIAPDAKPQFDAVSALAVKTASEATVKLVNNPRGPGPVITPSIVQTPGPESTRQPEPTPTEDVGGTPETGETPDPVPTPARAGLTPELGVNPTPEGVQHGVTWMRLAVGRLTTLIPSQGDGWRIQGISVADGPIPAPSLVRLSNADGTQLMTINPRNGDMWWFIAVNGAFDEIHLRETRGGQVFVVDPSLLRTLYGSFVEVPLYVLEHIELLPEPEPSPTLEPEPTAEPTRTPLVP